MNERRFDIDWLRVLVMLAVFFFHCAHFFRGDTPWILNNTEKSFVAEVFSYWLDMWFMPCFFLLSGVGSWYSLRSRSKGQYLLERVKRLLVPLYTVGLFLLLPPQFYFWIFSNERFHQSPTQVRVIYPFRTPFSSLRLTFFIDTGPIYRFKSKYSNKYDHNVTFGEFSEKSI